MPETLNDYVMRGRGAPSLSWDDFLDGQVWCLRPGVDFAVTTQLESVRHHAYRAAKARGKQVRTNIRDGNVIVQAVTPS
jgi:hypothetical protein